MEAAKEAGAHELIVTLKDGYDIYIVGWGMKLSRGQKQWLSIACVFRDITIPHGAFGYISHNECVHAYRIR